jgi:DNA repair photolyase
LDYSYIECKHAISLTKLPGLRYSINPYIGCEHGCTYCYSPSIFRSRDVSINWGRFVKAKINISDILLHQINKVQPGTIGIGTVTDPYQPLERNLELTRKCIEVISSKSFPASIQTKSSLILRDKDLINPDNFDIGVTITTLNKDLARLIQPNAPKPDTLIEVLDEFFTKKVYTWIFLGPIIPEINDDYENLYGIIKLAKKTKSTLYYDKLNLRLWVKERIEDSFIKHKINPKIQLSQVLNRKSGYWLKIKEKIEKICKNLNVDCRPAFPHEK